MNRGGLFNSVTQQMTLMHTCTAFSISSTAPGLEEIPDESWHILLHMLRRVRHGSLEYSVAPWQVLCCYLGRAFRSHYLAVCCISQAPLLSKR